MGQRATTRRAPRVHAWLSLALLASCASRADQARHRTHPDSAGSRAPAIVRDHAPIHGLRLYYEVHGAPRADAPPLLLLHGGGSTIETSFGAVLPRLAARRQVIAFDQQGHGRTNDVAERPFTFEQSAADALALLDHLRVARADVYGYSNGGSIALELALRHPERVRKLVLGSTMTERAGADAQFWAGFEHATLEQMPLELRDAYLSVAPDPGALRSFFEKSVERMRRFRDVPREALRSVECPVLVMIGDADIVRPEHAVELQRTFPHAQLAVLPGTDHMAFVRRADVLVPVLERFLDGSSRR